MNKLSFANQPVLLLLALLMITGCVGAGIGLVWTNQLSAQVGADIQRLEGALKELNDRDASLSYRVREVTEQISLQKLADRHLAGKMHRLDPEGGQVLVIPRAGLLSGGPQISSVGREEERFNVMDLAFMASGGEQNSVRQ